MNDCKAGGRCIQGKCICNMSYFGADCSIFPKDLLTGELTVNASSWQYFKLPDTAGTVDISVTSEGKKVESFVNKGGIPSRSFYTFYHKGSNLHLDLPSGGSFFAFHNPDISSPISVEVVIHNSFLNRLSSYWRWAILTFVLFTCVFLSVVYWWSKRKDSQRSGESLLGDSIEMSEHSEHSGR